MSSLRELGIDGTPGSALAGLVDGEHLTRGRERRLHIANGCSSLWQVDGLVVHLHCSIVCGERQAAPLKESIDGVDAVDGRIPSLGALLLQKPAAHLVERLLVTGRQTLQSLDGYGLRGNLIIIPRVTGSRCVIITADVFTIDGPLLQRLGILGGTPGITLREDNCRQGLLVDRL